MTIIVFLVDTSASMLQRTYLGISYLDYARLAIEQFLKQRQRDPASNGDRYMLMTFEEYPQNIKSGWKENQRIFNEQLKNLKARGSLNFESGLESVLRLLMVSRMQSGSGAGIETYGFGRYPSYAEHVVVIPVIDGSSLPPASSEAKVPKPRLLPGSELSTEGYRWDQRMYPIVLRLPGHQQPLQQRGNAPQEDQSIAQNFAENMGGRSFAIFSHRSLGPSIDQIIQRIQTNGVLIHFAKHGPDPPPTTETANNQSSREDEPDAWKNSLVLLKGKIGQQHSHWPIPEAYWPDSVKNALPSRSAHPTVAFKCESVAPMFNTEFPLDKYELDSSSPLAQYILNRKESNLCWQVFVENSFRQPGLGFPFGYIKISTSSTVTLYIMPYNYPELLSLLDMTKEFKHVNNAQFPQKFERYLTTVPAYYYSGLKKALSRLKAVPSTLEEANVKLYPYCNLGALWTRIKHQGQQEFETACTTVIRNLQETPTLQLPNPALLVKISRSRHQLGKGPLTDCAFRPAVAPFKANIPADTFKDANIFLLETPPQATAPSLQFKNPFDIARANLCSQLEKMRFNFDQQVQASNLHVLEGGLPGQKIKLQHAEDLHSLPICKMGIYEDYMKSLIAIGLAPKRELEPQAARPHAFGNPFKLDKKNMSVVDEVGEVNASAAGTSSGNGGQQPEAGGNATGDRKERKVRGERAVSEGTGGNTKLVRPKRRPGPLDSNRLHTWKLKRRRLSCPFGGSDLGDLASNSGDMGEEVHSAPDMLDLGELRLELDEDEEMEPEEEEQQPTMTAMPSTSYQSTATAQEQQEEEEVDEIQIMGHFRAQPANNHFASSMAEEEQPPPADVPSILAQSGSRDYGLGQNEQNHVEFSPSSPVVVGNGHHQHSVDAAGIVGANAVAPLCQPSTSEPSPSIDLVANRPRRDRSQQQQQILPTISQREFLRKQREVRQLVRRIEPSAESLYRQVMEVVSDRNLSREKRHQLLELGHREAKLFKRQKLAEQLTRELQNNSGANNSILRPADQQRQNRQLHLLVNHNGFSNSSG